MHTPPKADSDCLNQTMRTACPLCRQNDATVRQMVGRAGLEVVRFPWKDRLRTSDTMWLVAQRLGSQAIAAA